IREFPFHGLKGSKGQGGRPMSDEEYRTIMNNSPALFRRYVMFLRYTGCRPNECSRLRWSNIDFERSVAILQEHKTAKKTGAARMLVLPPVIVRLLKWIRERGQQSPAALWLAQVLSAGPIGTHRLAKLAREHGYTVRQIYRGLRSIGAKFEWRRMNGSAADLRCRHRKVPRKVYFLD